MASQLRALLALFLVAIPVSGANGIGTLKGKTQTPTSSPNAIQLQSTEWVIPELILGGEWTSDIRLTNRGSQAIPTTNVSFWDNNGNPLPSTFVATDGSTVSGTGFSFSLPVGAIVEATFTGSSEGSAYGMATIECAASGCGTKGLYAEVTLRNHNATRPDFVVVFPLETPVPLQYMLFDGRTSAAGTVTTTLYVVNNNAASTTVFMDVCDTNNNVLRTVTLDFGPLGSQILTLNELSPETVGIQGTLVFRGQTADVNTGGVPLITATALRIDPSNSFAPVRAWIPGN